MRLDPALSSESALAENTLSLPQYLSVQSPRSGPTPVPFLGLQAWVLWGLGPSWFFLASRLPRVSSPTENVHIAFLITSLGPQAHFHVSFAPTGWRLGCLFFLWASASHLGWDRTLGPWGS